MAYPTRTRSKYNNAKTKLDGYVFDSKSEARRYAELLLREKAGEIAHLVVHPVFPLVVNNKKVGKYIGDFKYTDLQTNAKIVEDVKGVRTSTYMLKKRLVDALYGIKILEITT